MILNINHQNFLMLIIISYFFWKFIISRNSINSNIVKNLFLDKFYNNFLKLILDYIKLIL